MLWLVFPGLLLSLITRLLLLSCVFKPRYRVEEQVGGLRQQQWTNRMDGLWLWALLSFVCSNRYGHNFLIFRIVQLRTLKTAEFCCIRYFADEFPIFKAFSHVSPKFNSLTLLCTQANQSWKFPTVLEVRRSVQILSISVQVLHIPSQ